MSVDKVGTSTKKKRTIVKRIEQGEHGTQCIEIKDIVEDIATTLLDIGGSSHINPHPLDQESTIVVRNIKINNPRSRTRAHVAKKERTHSPSPTPSMEDT